MTTAQQLLDAWKEKQESAEPVITALYLSKVWVAFLKTKHSFVKPLTQREIRKLQGWVTQAGPEWALVAVQYLLNNWPVFVSEVAQLEHLETVPNEPNLEFANKHFDAVLALSQA